MLGMGFPSSAIRRPIVYGSNSILNGSFTADLSNWITQGSVTPSWGAGQVLFTLIGTSGGAYQDIAVIAGRSYLITMVANVVTAASMVCRLYSDAFVTQLTSCQTSSASQVTVTCNVIATTTMLRVFLEANGSATNTALVDSISCQEISG